MSSVQFKSRSIPGNKNRFSTDPVKDVNQRVWFLIFPTTIVLLGKTLIKTLSLFQSIASQGLSNYLLPKQVYCYFLEMQKTVAVGEKGACFGSHGKTHVSTFLWAV